MDEYESDIWYLYGLPAEPTSEKAVWDGAKQIIDLFPEEPELAAAQRADKALEQGDLSGFALWNRITKAVAQLIKQTNNPRSIN